MRLCTVEGCGRRHKARGLCMRCYQQRWHQDPRRHAKRLELAKEWKATHPEQHQANEYASKRRRRDGLTDWYVRELLRNQDRGRKRPGIRLPASAVTQEMVEAKRVQLRILRQLRAFAIRRKEHVARVAEAERARAASQPPRKRDL